MIGMFLNGGEQCVNPVQVLIFISLMGANHKQSIHSVTTGRKHF